MQLLPPAIMGAINETKPTSESFCAAMAATTPVGSGTEKLKCEDATGLTELNNCSFVSCNFAQLRVFDSTKFTNITFDHCTVDALMLVHKDREVWDPIEIRRQLEQLGVAIPGDVQLAAESVPAKEPDPELHDLEKIVRYFMRSTHISESVMLIKLGPTGQVFIDDTLPLLLKQGVMEEIENRGGNNQRRFRLRVSLQNINAAVASAKGSFEDFLGHFGNLD